MASARGRPKREIDYEAVEKLARLGCTIDEIAGYLEIGATTLKRDSEFRTLYKKGLDNVKMSLRRAQLRKALEQNNTTMQIWLGKQLLDQKENPSDTAIREGELKIKKETLKITKRRLELEEMQLLGTEEDKTEDDGFMTAIDNAVERAWDADET